MPTKINTMSPMPFCPSFEPCAKLTPVQVNTSNPRIQNGGGRSPSGALNRAGLRNNALAASSKSAAATKPIKGENINALTVSCTLAQLTPSPKTLPGLINEFIRPTPTIEPIKVCELEAGSPRYHVPKFQMIDEIKSANTMAKPAPEPTLITSSTGSSATIPKATAPLEVNTPIRFHIPDQTTAWLGFNVWV